MRGYFTLIVFSSLEIVTSTSNEVVSAIRNIAEQETGVIAVNEILTMHLGPEDIPVNLSIDFADKLSSFD